MESDASRPARGLAARAGRWSAAHRKTAIWGWVILVVAAVALGGFVGTKTLSDDQSNVGESGQADAMLDRAFPKTDSETVLVQSTRARATDPSFRAAVADVERRLGQLGFVRNPQPVH